MAALGRLSKGPVFDRVYAEGTVIHGPLFVLRVRPNGVEETRWGFAVGKKLAPSAVVRNRIRRKLREAARGAPRELLGVDLIVTAKRPLLEASFREIESELSRLTAIVGERGLA